jgi:hypothetical protein
LIAGVRRAYPYVDSAELEEIFCKHADALFRTVHVAPLTVSVQALMLLFQVNLAHPVAALVKYMLEICVYCFIASLGLCDIRLSACMHACMHDVLVGLLSFKSPRYTRPPPPRLQVMSSQSAVNDRFHSALYALLLRPALENSSTLPMLFGLLYQALSADVSARRVAAFIKRMLQFAAGAPAHVACGVLMVVSEVLKAKPVLWAAVLEPEDRGIEEFQDAADATTDADSEYEAGDAEGSDEEHHASATPSDRNMKAGWKRAPVSQSQGAVDILLGVDCFVLESSVLREDDGKKQPFFFIETNVKTGVQQITTCTEALGPNSRYLSFQRSGHPYYLRPDVTALVYVSGASVRCAHSHVRRCCSSTVCMIRMYCVQGRKGDSGRG